MTQAETWAIVPAKGFARAKSRLEATLGTPARIALAEQLLDHVLRTLTACERIQRVLVVTDNDGVAQAVRGRGASVLRDPAGASSLAHVVDAGIAHARAAGADSCLVLMGDLGALGASDVNAMLDALTGADLVLAADRRGTHTNALAVALRETFATCFGHPESFAEHRARAHERQLRVAVVERPGLAIDVDDASDLDALRALSSARPRASA